MILILLLAGQEIQHGRCFTYSGAGADAQHSVEHGSGHLQLWTCAGEEQEEPHSQGWRL